MFPTKSYVPPSATRSRSAACASTTSGVPFVSSSPIESRPIRARSTPRIVSASAAPMKPNCTRCSGRTSTFAPTSTMITGWSGTGTGIASAGRWMPRARRMLKRPAASAGPVDPPETNASASPSATARAARTIEASGRRADRRDRVGRLRDRHRGVDDLDARGAGPISSAGPYRRTRTPCDAASAAPSATSDGPRSAPLASTATVMLIGGRLLSGADSPTGACAPGRAGRAATWLVLVVVIVIVHVHDLAPGVGPAHRADPVRQARAVALRARVVRRRGDLVVRATLRGAAVRLLLLGDGHERRHRVVHRSA